MNKCKSCGAPIVWGITENGRPVPMDPPEKRYVERSIGDSDLFVEIKNTWLSHFATCPDADLHRKKT